MSQPRSRKAVEEAAPVILDEDEQQKVIDDIQVEQLRLIKWHRIINHASFHKCIHNLAHVPFKNSFITLCAVGIIVFAFCGVHQLTLPFDLPTHAYFSPSLTTPLLLLAHSTSVIAFLCQARFVRRHFAPEVKDSSFPPLSQRNLESDLFISCLASTAAVTMFWMVAFFMRGFEMNHGWVFAPALHLVLVYYGHSSLQDVEKGIMQLQMFTYRCKKA